MRNLLEKKWEFESNRGFVADEFLQILNAFDVSIVDVYMPSYLDFSQIEFIATEAQKEQIEYVFKRSLGNDPFKRFQWKTVLRSRRAFYAIY